MRIDEKRTDKVYENVSASDLTREVIGRLLKNHLQTEVETSALK